MQPNSITNTATFKRIKTPVLGIAITVVLSSFLVFKPNDFATAHNASADSIPSYLALYGKYVFNRESCNNCHSLLDSNTIHKISLDGIGNKFSNSWHYNHLNDPQMMVIDSKMPAFASLNERPINRNSYNYFILKYHNNQPDLNSDKSWKILLAEANQMIKLLKKDGITGLTPTENLAVIAYLQQLPASRQKQQSDSLVNAATDRKQKVWDSNILNKYNNLIPIATNPENAQNGKLVFDGICIVCHGKLGEGKIGPNLTDQYWLNGASVDKIISSIVKGIPEKGMMAWRNQLSPTEVAEVVAYILSIQNSNPPDAKMPQGKKE